MSIYYKDYLWKEGIPYGVMPLEIPTGEYYKIPMDPYRKYISIEKYLNGALQKIIYDSVLIDFRKLKQADHTAWQKTVISESPEKTICLLRDQNDRVIFEEIHSFKEAFCKECLLKSAHGIPLSIHRMSYTKLGDPFNGVILFDLNEHPVMLKHYEADGETGEFTLLLKEDWSPSLLPKEV